jgi:hypothetical protein
VSPGDVVAVVVWTLLALTGRAALRAQRREDGLGWRQPGMTGRWRPWH